MEKEHTCVRCVIYAPHQPWAWTVRTLFPTSHQWLLLSAERADHETSAVNCSDVAPGLAHDGRQLPSPSLSPRGVRPFAS